MITETLAKPFSNTMETTLLMIGFALYLHNEESSLCDHLMPVILAIAVAVRCTSAIGWFFLIVFHILSKKQVILIYFYIG